MNCPVDNTELRITERQGIEIDYCPKCRGVWLDRGELDKLIERTAVAPARGDRDDDFDYRARHDDVHRRGEGGYPPYEREEYDREGYPRRKSRRRSLLEDLFDID